MTFRHKKKKLLICNSPKNNLVSIENREKLDTRQSISFLPPLRSREEERETSISPIHIHTIIFTPQILIPHVSLFCRLPPQPFPTFFPYHSLNKITRLPLLPRVISNYQSPISGNGNTEPLSTSNSTKSDDLLDPASRR